MKKWLMSVVPMLPLTLLHKLTNYVSPLQVFHDNSVLILWGAETMKLSHCRKKL